MRGVRGDKGGKVGSRVVHLDVDIGEREERGVREAACKADHAWVVHVAEDVCVACTQLHREQQRMSMHVPFRGLILRERARRLRWCDRSMASDMVGRLGDGGCEKENEG